jgi:hypothetical protein
VNGSVILATIDPSLLMVVVQIVLACHAGSPSFTKPQGKQAAALIGIEILSKGTFQANVSDAAIALPQAWAGAYVKLGEPGPWYLLVA